jgi:hypothetical protein
MMTDRGRQTCDGPVRAPSTGIHQRSSLLISDIRRKFVADFSSVRQAFDAREFF